MKRGSSVSRRSSSLRRGSLMIILLATIVIGAVIAAQVIPNQVTILRRADESQLKVSLAQIRQAIDLDRRLAERSPCNPAFASLAIDPTNPAYVEGYLNALADSGLLRQRGLRDPLVFGMAWGTQTTSVFWQARLNLLHSIGTPTGSFEAGTVYDSGIGTITPLGWKNVLDPTSSVATLSTDTPSVSSTEFDDYPGQNKMGNPLEDSGTSLRIEKLP